MIDAQDAVWPKLRVWIDANHDGISQPQELHTLAQLGITKLDLKDTLTPYVDAFGNRFRYKGHLAPLPQDHVDRTMYDVFLSVNGLELPITPKVAEAP